MDGAAPEARAADAAPSDALRARFAQLGFDDAALAGLARWRDLLADWSGRMNLIGPKELPLFWERHALDSAQLAPLAPLGGSWIDLGAGAGFPGVAIAIAQKAQGAGDTALVESVGKKASFLRAVADALGLPARIEAARWQDVPRARYQVVTARAFAPLPRLFEAAHRFWGPATVGIFPKGKSLEEEIAAAERLWRFRAERVGSITGDGAILRVTELRPR
jgi:16S rRNA (guanine527-N7)-methyltransferase